MNRHLLTWIVLGSLLAPTPAQRRGAQQQRERALSEPFRGITAKGEPRKGLFKIESTGVSTAPVRTAANAFLKGLSAAQRKKCTFPVQDVEWRKWDNRHRYQRQGVGFAQMSEEQRRLAFAMLRASLSAKGLKTTRDIMRLNETLAELTNRFDEYGEWLYWISIMGQPSETKPWGWQLDGHHVVINYFVLGDQVVMTPTFMGSEPVRATSGKFKGTVILQREEALGLALMRSLDAEQRKKAIVTSRKGPTNNLTEAFRDNVVLNYAGIRARDLKEDQRKQLLALIGEFVGNMREGHAKVKMDEVRAHLDETCFAWIGETAEDGVFYYRVHSPVVLIEFDHQRPIALARSRVPTRNHIHTVVRTPNGNDYGKDLLRQHYERHHSHENRQGEFEHGFVDSSGVKLHYATAGEGPLVVMLHGFPDYWYTWRKQMRAISKTHKVCALDLRGYNKSDKPKGVANYRMPVLVADVAATVRHFDRKKAIIVGHDWGGAIAWNFAMLHPEMTEKLIVLNLPHPNGLLRELRTNPEQKRNSGYARRFQQEGAHRALTAQGLASWVKDRAARAKYRDAFARSDFEAMLNYYKANYPRDSDAAIDPKRVPKVKAPVLMLHGLDDKALLPGALNGTWNWLEQDLTLVTIPRAGHFVQQDAADLVTRTMVSWLGR